MCAAPTMTVTSTATMATARTPADPCSPRARLDCGQRLCAEGKPRQHNRLHSDGGDDEVTAPMHLHPCPAGGDALGGADRRRRRVPARNEPCRFPRRIDAARLRRHRGHPGHAQDEDGHQRDDRESRLDRDGPGVRTGYVAVFRARLMMLVSAFTTESPVMTV